MQTVRRLVSGQLFWPVSGSGKSRLVAGSTMLKARKAEARAELRL
jgi:hypothetical protein